MRATPDDEDGRRRRRRPTVPACRCRPGPADVRVGLSRLDRATAAGPEADRWLYVLGGAGAPVGSTTPSSGAAAHGGRGRRPALSLADAGPLSWSAPRPSDGGRRGFATRPPDAASRSPAPLDTGRSGRTVVGDGVPSNRSSRTAGSRCGWRRPTASPSTATGRRPRSTRPPAAGGREPLRTFGAPPALGRQDGFGVRLGRRPVGRTAVGDDVEVLSRGAVAPPRTYGVS